SVCPRGSACRRGSGCPRVIARQHRRRSGYGCLRRQPVKEGPVARRTEFSGAALSVPISRCTVLSSALGASGLGRNGGRLESAVGPQRISMFCPCLPVHPRVVVGNGVVEVCEHLPLVRTGQLPTLHNRVGMAVGAGPNEALRNGSFHVVVIE